MLSRLNSSQTKFGIVNLIYILKQNKLEEYINGTYTLTKSIDVPQLKGTLGISNFDEPLPSFWKEIQNHPTSIGCFTAFAIIFSHHKYIAVFKKSASLNMKGLLHKADFDSKDEKAFTNIRRVLIEAGVTPVKFSSSDDVPYDFSNLYENGDVGILVKELLENRLKKIGWKEDINSEFLRDFFEQCYKYEFHKVFSLTKEQFTDWLNGNGLNTQTSTVADFNFDVTVPVDTHILTSLRAKQFMIITGPSGTGKTFGIRKLAHSLNPLPNYEEHFNIAFIPVEAGWKDGRHLIGYRNPFSSEGELYETTPLINLLLKANSNEYKSVPFFVIFDEMNLSHVEMYFARFLSLIETSRHPDLSNEPLLNVEELKLLKKSFQHDYIFIPLINEAIENGGLFVSKNVFFIGTVNIDETTYMFSPKVLDRAFVIEKNTEKPSFTINTPNNDYIYDMIIKDVYSFLLGEEFNGIYDDLITLLDELYLIVESDFPFGYRVIRESMDYFFAADDLMDKYKVPLEWLAENDSLYDEILMQKILPKIHGNRKQLTDILKQLIHFCVRDSKVRFPKSHKKLLAMQKTLQINGYSGFVV